MRLGILIKQKHKTYKEKKETSLRETLDPKETK